MLLWQIGADFRYDPEVATEVEVTFTAEPGGRTFVELRHRHPERYGDKADMTRAIFDSPEGWTGNLAAYAKAAA